MHHKVEHRKAKNKQRLVESKSHTYLASSNSSSKTLLSHFIIRCEMLSGRCITVSIPGIAIRVTTVSRLSKEPLRWMLRVGNGLVDVYCSRKEWNDAKWGWDDGTTRDGGEKQVQTPSWTLEHSSQNIARRGTSAELDLVKIERMSGPICSDLWSFQTCHTCHSRHSGAYH